MGIETYKPLIHNEWVKTYKSEKVENPYTGKPIARVYFADGDFLDMAVESALQGFKVARRLTGFQRYELLKKISEGIKARSEDFVKTIVAESGKPIRFAKNEVLRAQFTFEWAAEEARRMGGEILPLDAQPQTAGYTGMVRRFPLGVILGISPFNFPLNLVAHKVAPAIASGNAIILKPASTTPLTALLLGEVSKAASLPPGILNILPTSGKNAETLVKDGRIKKLTFTGSAKVGWYLKSIAGKKKVTLELGGNAAAIVEPDSDWPAAVSRLCLGSFAYAGQVCISVQRIYVQKTIFNSFLEKFLEEVAANIPYGDPTNPQTVSGPMIDKANAKRVESWIEEARKQGAKILAGGERKKNLIQPTVLTATQPDMKVVCEEIFGPVVVIEPYDSFEEAIRMVNNSYYGLQAAVFTKDIEKIQEAYTRIEVGGLIVNDYPTFRIDHMPYGGVKDSGFGREGLKYAMEEMTEPKLLVLKGVQ